MKNINRADIHIISRHSNWPVEGINKSLEENVYNDKADWQKFLRLFFVAIGICFTTAGVLFFFAYNWEGLHKFVKLGLIEGLIILSTLFILFSKIKDNIKNIILTGVAFLVGILFAVFGQIYQTGANAYDFFFGWTLFITLWALIANFPPLWLMYLILINATLGLYAEQVAHGWSDIFVVTILFCINAIALILAHFLSKAKILKAPNWFTNIIALAVCGFATIGITMGIIDNRESSFLLLFLLTIVLYIFGIMYSLREKRTFYIAVISFSVISIVSSFLVKISSDAGMFLFITLFVVVSVTFVIKTLIDLQKKWKDG